MNELTRINVQVDSPRCDITGVGGYDTTFDLCMYGEDLDDFGREFVRDQIQKCFSHIWDTVAYVSFSDEKG